MAGDSLCAVHAAEESAAVRQSELSEIRSGSEMYSAIQSVTVRRGWLILLHIFVIVAQSG